MSDLHTAAVELEQAISRVDPSTLEFQKLDFHFETPLEEASFGVMDNRVLIRFGADELVGYARPIRNPAGGNVLESLEQFLAVAERIQEYELVTNGVVNRGALEELKGRINSDFVMIVDGEVSHIKLTQIRMYEDTPEVTIFFEGVSRRNGNSIPMFDRLDNKGPDSRVQLFLKPAD